MNNNVSNFTSNLVTDVRTDRWASWAAVAAKKLLKGSNKESKRITRTYFCSKPFFTTLLHNSTLLHNFYSHLMFTSLVHNFNSQFLFLTLVRNNCSNNLFTTFVQNFVHNYYFQLYFTTIVQKICSQLLFKILFTNFAHNLLQNFCLQMETGTQNLSKVENSCLNKIMGSRIFCVPNTFCLTKTLAPEDSGVWKIWESKRILGP